MDTTMTIKLNRGPAKGKRYNADSGTLKFLIEVPRRNLADSISWDAPIPYADCFRRGEYHKSHTVLKDGTVVFEWMGWIN
jgi:hypothetical protein